MQNKDRSELEHVWAVIGHDLATPLQVIHSNLSHMDTGLLPILLDTYKKAKAAGLDIQYIAPAQLAHFQGVLSSTQSVVDDVRQKVARWNHQLLSKHFNRPNYPVEIVKCIKDAIKNYQTSYSLKDKSRIHIDLQEATVLGDEDMIQYVIFELLTNAEYAIEASGSNVNGNVFISSKKDGNNYHLKIKNECVAINSAEVEKFFDPYFSNKTSHIGLGLTFCKQVMQNMQGKITCHTENDGKMIELELLFQMVKT